MDSKRTDGNPETHTEEEGEEEGELKKQFEMMEIMEALDNIEGLILQQASANSRMEY